MFSGSEATARALLESAAQGIVIVNRDGRILQANARTGELFGYQGEELIGQPMEILLPESLRSLHARQREEYFRRPRKRPIGIGMDLVGRRKDGSEFPTEVSLSYVREGGQLLAIAFISDISERKRSEEALRQANETLAVVINASPLAIWASDLDGNLTLWNRAAERIFGWKAEEVLGRPLPLIPPGQEDDFRTLFELTRNGQGQSNVERIRLRKDGGPIAASVWTAPLSDAQGAIRGVLAIAADSTERKQWEAHLRQSQKMEAIGRLAGGIAHDFNNLLTVITGYSDLVLRALDKANPLRRDIEEIRNAGERASRLTQQLLAFGRRQVSQPRVLDLNSLIRDMHPLLRRTIGENCEIIPGLDPSPACVQADPGQIEQVLINLVLNARDAMPRGGRITVETANVDLGAEYVRTHPGMQSGSYVMLAVSDQGHGMDEQTRTHIFEPFFSTKEKGTGLGLATVYGIVKQSRGEIWVYSEPGFGSTFKIYFPRASGAAAGVEPAALPSAAARNPGRSETILLVEDEEGVRKLVREMLRLRGYRVLEAGSGQEALRIGRAHSGPIHLLLTDVVMPRMQGSELARRLLAMRPRLKVLFMSGYTDNMVLQHGVLEAGTAFLQKPFTAELLERKLREVLDSGARTA